jgi:hypothetical protein
MRSILITATVFCLSTGIAFAEVTVAPRPSANPHPSAVQPTKRGAHETAITECEQMWDRGTHMTKRDWSQTCRRVQDRLQQLEVR